MNFRINGAERMRIDSSGQVGIGVTDPKSLLQIDGENTAGVLTISHGGASNSISNDEILGTIDFSGYDLTNTYAIGAKIQARANGNWADASTNYAGTDLEFYTQDDSTTDRLSSPRMVIDSSGLLRLLEVSAGVGQMNIKAGVVVADDADVQGADITPGNVYSCLLLVQNASAGQGAMFHHTYATNIVEISDPSNEFSVTDGSDGTINVYKSNNTTAFRIENKSGGSVQIGCAMYCLEAE